MNGFQGKGATCGAVCVLLILAGCDLSPTREGAMDHVVKERVIMVFPAPVVAASGDDPAQRDAALDIACRIARLYAYAQRDAEAPVEWPGPISFGELGLAYIGSLTNVDGRSDFYRAGKYESFSLTFRTCGTIECRATWGTAIPYDDLITIEQWFAVDGLSEIQDKFIDLLSQIDA